MNFEYIFVRLFAGVLAVTVVAAFYLCAKFCAAGNDSGHRRWDQPASLLRQVQVYGGCALAALFVAGLVWSRTGSHQTDNGVIAFIVLGTAAAFGAASGFTRSLPPPRTIAEALRRYDPSSPLVHYVPAAEQHLAEAKAFQARVDASMADLLKKVDGP